MKNYRIAAIPGDGIGNEVLPEGIRVLEAAGKRFGLSFTLIISTGAASITPSMAA